MLDLLKIAIGFIVQNWPKVIGTLDFAKKTLDVGEEFKQLMPDIGSEKKAEEIVKKQELGWQLVTLAGIEASYNLLRTLLVVITYGIMVRFVAKFMMNNMRKGHQ